MSTLSDEERAHLLERMRVSIDRWGFETFVAAPIVEPSDRFFPDPFAPDLRGVRTVMRRLLTYAGLGALSVEVEGRARPGLDRMAETLCVVGELSDRGVLLEVWAEGPPEDLALTLAHEAARIFRELRSDEGCEGASVGHPYRAPVFQPEQPDALPDEAFEEEVSIAACYLGFGLLVAKGAHVYRAEGEMSGTLAVTRWVHRCLGALAPDEACFLLAAQCVVRGVDDERLARFRGYLGPNQAKMLADFVAELRGSEDALREALGLPSPDEWPEEGASRPAPLEDDGWRPPTPEPPPPVALRRPVFRRRQHRGWNLATSAGFLSLAAFFVILLKGSSHLVQTALFVLPALTVAAYFVGKRMRRGDICSSCERALPASAHECPTCGGVIRGAIDFDENALEALERLPDVPTFGDLVEVRPQADADPRYVERGVKCPHCAWIPDGGHHWQCPICEGEHFNTFEQGGQCPDCEKVFEDTSCPRCDHLSPYDWWWPAED